MESKKIDIVEEVEIEFKKILSDERYFKLADASYKINGRCALTQSGYLSKTPAIVDLFDGLLHSETIGMFTLESLKNALSLQNKIWYRTLMHTIETYNPENEFVYLLEIEDTAGINRNWLSISGQTTRVIYVS